MKIALINGSPKQRNSACEQKRKRLEYLRDELGHDINVEGAEIPNADIIYTFDNEIINNYYLRDQEGIIYTPADEY